MQSWKKKLTQFNAITSPNLRKEIQKKNQSFISSLKKKIEQYGPMNRKSRQNFQHYVVNLTPGKNQHRNNLKCKLLRNILDAFGKI